MLQRCEDAGNERLFCAVEAPEGELLAVLDDEEREFIEFQILLVVVGTSSLLTGT